MKKYKRIILVDDNETAIFLNRDVVKEFFSEIEVISYTNSQEFLDDALHTELWFSEPTLVLLDINMPGLFGFDTLERIEEERDSEFGQFEVVMVTSSDLKRDNEMAHRFSCVMGYIIKPMRAENFMNVLKNTTVGKF